MRFRVVVVPGRDDGMTRLCTNLPRTPFSAALVGCARHAIAVDVGTEIRVATPPTYDESPSGWRILWDGLWRRPKRALPVFLTITRAFTLASDERAHAACRDAGLALHPPLGDYASTDFTQIDPIAEMGFRYARERLAAWSAR